MLSTHDVELIPLIKDFLEHHNPPVALKSIMAHQVQVNYDRQYDAKSSGVLLNSKCPKCFQWFTSSQLHQHQRRNKKQCDSARFCLKVICQQQRYRTLLSESNMLSQHFLDSIQLQSTLLRHMDKQQEPQFQTSPVGLSGPLLSDIGTVLQNVSMDTILQFIGEFPITKAMLCILLSGITYHPTHESTVYYRSPNFYQPPNNLVLGEHLQLFIDLLYQNGYTIQEGATFKPVVVPPHFSTFIQYEDKDNADTYISLRKYFRERGMWVEDQLLPDTILVIVNLNNSHWILVHLFIDQLQCTFFPINPYHPTEPSNHDVSVGQLVANTFQEAFHTAQFSMEAPHATAYLPKQETGDVVNCGIFVLIYILILMDKDLTIHDILDMGTDSLTWERDRILLAAWLITKIEPKLA